MRRCLDVTLYWQHPPPEPSPRLQRWIDKINRGWTPNRRFRGWDYYSSAEMYGVYIWEYLNVLSPLLYGDDESAVNSPTPALPQ